MKIGIFQFFSKFGEKEYNLNRIENVLTHVDADLLVLPELCTTGYQFISRKEVHDLSESIPDGESTRRLMAICRRKKMHIAAGVSERNGDDCYNTSVLLGPEGYIGTYRKIHLFDEEKLWFQPGTEGFQVWDLGPAKVGMMICFDWIFPESARSLALAGADLICHPSNLVLPFCPDAMITRSVENRVFTATANRIGCEARGGKSPLNFTGLSQVTDPSGNRMIQFGSEEEGVKTVRIDVTLARNKHITSRNDLWEDRREELYQETRNKK
ncbi:acyltransferase [bacterium]|nr:acyltransferase [bacterium]